MGRLRAASTSTVERTLTCVCEEGGDRTEQGSAARPQPQPRPSRACCPTLQLVLLGPRLGQGLRMVGAKLEREQTVCSALTSHPAQEVRALITCQEKQKEVSNWVAAFRVLNTQRETESTETLAQDDSSRRA